MRNGVAGALVRDVVIAATERCISVVNVTANPHAKPFYESVGFVVDGLVETPYGHASQMHLDVI